MLFIDCADMKAMSVSRGAWEELVQHSAVHWNPTYANLLGVASVREQQNALVIQASELCKNQVRVSPTKPEGMLNRPLSQKQQTCTHRKVCCQAAGAVAFVARVIQTRPELAWNNLENMRLAVVRVALVTHAAMDELGRSARRTEGRAAARRTEDAGRC